MKRKLFFTGKLMALTILLAACQILGDTIPNFKSSNASTATATMEPNTYSNLEIGLLVHYPSGWSMQAPAQGDQALMGFSSSDQTIQSYLYAFPAQASDTPQSSIADLSGSVLTGLTDIQIVSDAALDRTDGSPAWSRVVNASSNGLPMEVNMTTVINGAHLYFMLTYASPSAYDDHANEVASLLNGITFVTPVINGVNRDQALFLVGGESTNPRDYDPATEHDSGDKRIFSGLVSFDPNLMLVP
jgi:hypothetical protein